MSLIWVGFVTVICAAEISSAEDSSTEKAKSTITAFLETLEKSKANEVLSFDSTAPHTADARAAVASPSEPVPQPSKPALQPSKPNPETRTAALDFDFEPDSASAEPTSSNYDNKPAPRPTKDPVKPTKQDDEKSDLSTNGLDTPTPQSMTAIAPVHSMTLANVFTAGELPENRYRPTTQAARRDPYWGTQNGVTKQWVADNLRHKTLYFEDLRLERHGQAHGDYLQSHLSSLRFLGDAVVFPLRLLMSPPERCFYVQCEGRPGVCPH